MKYVTLKQKIPKGKVWFTFQEFAALFGKGKASAEIWVRSGRIPKECVKGLSPILINVKAVKFVDGKARDLRIKRNKESDGGNVDYSKLIEMEGYELTAEEHKRRLEVKEAGLKNLTKEREEL